MAGSWLRYALLTTVIWGVWGAFASLPSEHGFPDTLIYVVWALTMIAPAGCALLTSRWQAAARRALGAAGACHRSARCRRADAAVPRRHTRAHLPDFSDRLAVAGGDHRCCRCCCCGERTGTLGWAGIVLARRVAAAVRLFARSRMRSHGGAWFVSRSASCWPGACRPTSSSSPMPP